ncbi:MAG: excinuclease ABC subunit UvrC, partial [Clostridia bacterium]|nr:excinuclease ABC subunit UvrC [Clostridia bacterium]
HKTRAITSDGGEIAISQARKVFALVTGIQDEVHRYAIGYHHQKHSKGARKSVLTDIPGIGPKKSELLCKEFKTLDAIRRADLADLSAVLGISHADAVNIKKVLHYN